MGHPEQLRAWAKGTYPQEAATELLLRAHGGRFAGPGKPWIGTSTNADGETVEAWIDFEAIPEHANAGTYSGGERRFLLLTASFGAGVPIDLSDVITGLDREIVDLALAAVSHAAGSHQHSGLSYHGNGTPKAFVRLTALYPWPSKAGQEMAAG